METDQIKKDPTDNKFLARALEAKADYVVSGEHHLLELKHFHGIQIVDAKSFVKNLTANKWGCRLLRKKQRRLERKPTTACYD